MTQSKTWKGRSTKSSAVAWSSLWLCFSVVLCCVYASSAGRAAVIGPDSSVPVTLSFLRSGRFFRTVYRRSRSVARLRFQSYTKRQWTTYVGTGFMLSPSLMLTNRHNIGSGRTTRYATATFLYHRDLPRQGHTARNRTYSIHRVLVRGQHKSLDFSLIRLRRRPLHGRGKAPGVRFGRFQLARRMPRVGTPLLAIGHPKGWAKRLSFRNCRVLRVLRREFYHSCDTRKGSSGSPLVLASNPNVVVGIHFAGVRHRYNKAVRIDYIRPWLRKYLP